MCGIYGVLHSNNPESLDITPLLDANEARGRDAYGYHSAMVGDCAGYRSTDGYSPMVDDEDRVLAPDGAGTTIGNMRAMPTTEWFGGQQIQDVQPFTVGNWTIVHNGTIANDKALCEQFALHPPTKVDSWVIAGLLDAGVAFADLPKHLVGSYAILAVNALDPDRLHYMTNYQPLYRVHTAPYNGKALSSVPLGHKDEQLPAYTHGTLSGKYVSIMRNAPRPARKRALVVCSGGLDSTSVAAWAKAAHAETALLHFDYGCRATSNERKAVEAIAKHLDVPLHVITTDLFTRTIGGSNLTGTKNTPVADGEAGAELAHEWVPARNLVMSSIAIAFAEAHGYNVIALGTNMEEAGAYSDNTEVFYDNLRRLLPNAVGVDVPMEIATPLGNLMKHEIVAFGRRFNTPFHLTWSCYEQGDKHCGNCGPCHMRKIAFQINNLTDPVFA